MTQLVIVSKVKISPSMVSPKRVLILTTTPTTQACLSRSMQDGGRRRKEEGRWRVLRNLRLRHARSTQCLFQARACVCLVSSCFPLCFLIVCFQLSQVMILNIHFILLYTPSCSHLPLPISFYDCHTKYPFHSRIKDYQFITPLHNLNNLLQNPINTLLSVPNIFPTTALTPSPQPQSHPNSITVL